MFSVDLPLAFRKLTSSILIGKNIAMMEMGKLVPQILRRFDLEWASEKPDWEVTTWWFARQKGLITRFVARH